MILSFKDWLTGNMGIPGEYQFTKNYWISLALVILSVIIVIVLGASKKIDEKNKNRILKFYTDINLQ